MEHKTDIVIFGAGIAGLWLHNILSKAGYNSLLLETRGVGGGQSICSQGILHSGLKYSFAGKVNKLAQSISAMPERWKACIKGEGELDLRATDVAAQSQMLMIPKGFMGGLIKLVTEKTLGNQVHRVAKENWPQEVVNSGFKGDLIYMDEPVLNVPSLIRALYEPYKDSIRQIDWDDVTVNADQSITIGDHVIRTDHLIFTAAATNHEVASKLGHDVGLKTQKRPLLMGMLRPAPFPLYAHWVGRSDKPVATITTHTDKNGDLVWYLGGQTAEREKEAPAEDMINFAKKAFKKYMPQIDFSGVHWGTLPIDRVEGKSETEAGCLILPLYILTELSLLLADEADLCADAWR